MRHDATATPTSVYRYYDAADVPIYVGVTDRATSRNLEHYAKAEWWQYVTRQDVEHLPNRQAALALEKRLIREHRPPFNKQHNAFHAEMKDIYLAFAAGLHGGADESFIDQYRRLGQSIPLRVIEGRNPESGIATFATLPFHFPVAQTVYLKPGKRPTLMQKGVRVGSVAALETEGRVLTIRAAVRRDVESFTTARAVVTVATLKKPIQTRLRRVLLGEVAAVL